MVLPSFFAILLIMGLLKNLLKHGFVQAILRGMKPCVIGIVLATGVYMVLGNCFGTISALKINLRAVIVTVILVTSMFGYKHFKKKKLSPILLITLSAVVGIVVYGM